MLNFTWWVNRKDADGMNIFQGGFLGLDNIGVFDRSAPLPTGGYIEQSMRGEMDLDFLRATFNKLVLNFSSPALKNTRPTPKRMQA